MSEGAPTGRGSVLSRWPKRLPELTEEQKRIRESFMTLWHEILPARYGVIERFNHGYPASRRIGAVGRKPRVLEIGAGLGAHMAFEDLAGQDYTALELRPDMARTIRTRFPAGRVVVGDCQAGLPFPEGSFDKVMAIHVLEHLPDLPAALAEIRRVLAPGGRFVAVIPCEGGLLYGLCRRISAKRVFERRYKQPYDWFIRSEHVNTAGELLAALDVFFRTDHSRYFPLSLPLLDGNVVVGLTLSPRS